MRGEDENFDEKLDKESLMETIEILSDPETMKSITRGIEDYKKGRVKTLEEVEKNLDIGH